MIDGRMRESEPLPASHRGDTAVTGTVDTDVFLRRYLAHAGTQLPGRPMSALTEHRPRPTWTSGAAARPGEILVSARDLDGDTTAIDIVIDDAPVPGRLARAELDRTQLPGIEHVLHPQIVVTRDADGRAASRSSTSTTTPRSRPARSPSRGCTSSSTDCPRPSEHQVGRRRPAPGAAPTCTTRSTTPRTMYQLIRTLADELADDPGQFDRETSDRGRRAAALAGRRQLHDPRATRRTRPTSWPDPQPGERRRRRGRAARRRRGSRRSSCCRPSAAARRW